MFELRVLRLLIIVGNLSTFKVIAKAEFIFNALALWSTIVTYFFPFIAS